MHSLLRDVEAIYAVCCLRMGTDDDTPLCLCTYETMLTFNAYPTRSLWLRSGQARQARQASHDRLV